jgi:TRAP-type C4-dicarboxylate transport system permease small subunit
MRAELDPTGTGGQPRTRVSLKIEEVAIASGMAAIALITAANVVVRYLTNVSFAITEEYSVILMVIVAVLGTSYAIAGGRHIRIGYLIEKMGIRNRRRAEVASMALVILCFGLLLWYGAKLTYDEYRYEVTTAGLGNPQWLYTGWLPLLSLAVIGRAAGHLVRIARGEDS